MGDRTSQLARNSRASSLLPVPLSSSSSAGTPRLAEGCYLISYQPRRELAPRYEGTIRVEAKTGRLVASGDLYEHEILLNADLEPTEFIPDPGAGIPIFPIGSYRFYLRITNAREQGDGFHLTFEVLRFSLGNVVFFDGVVSNWLTEGTFTAAMATAPAEPGFPSPEKFFAGVVADATGEPVGDLTMGWVSQFLRKATVEIDRVPKSEAPLSGAGVDWTSVFGDVGWDITPVLSDSDIVEPVDGSWNKAEAHKAMVARRDSSDLNAEWRYHVLAVRKIEKVNPAGLPEEVQLNGESGLMYDGTSFEENVLRREGMMVASDYVVPDQPKWGLLRGKRQADTVDYFRAALHELGHAMGLEHNDSDNGLMNTSETIAGNATTETPFPNNIIWKFAADDEHRLRHWPDLVVRPGGTFPHTGDRAPSTPFTSHRHQLEVAPVSTSVPLGAPVRINLKLRNLTGEAVDSPSSLSLNSGFVRGHVIDAAGTVRTFLPLVLNENHHATAPLPPEKSLEDSLTLLHGVQGALFPAPGSYRIVVEVMWRGKTADVKNQLEFVVTSAAEVTVTGAADDAHRAAARKVLDTPDTLYALALGGDHLTQGIDAIHAALDSRVLRPHFAYIEAKRLATRFFQRKPDLKAAAALIDETTVMSPAEYRKAARIGLRAST